MEELEIVLESEIEEEEIEITEESQEEQSISLENEDFIQGITEEDLLKITGDLDNLDTEDTSTLVNAINEVLEKTGIPELVNKKIDMLTIEPGIYWLSGKSTKIYRGDKLVLASPVGTDYCKNLFIVQKASENTEGALLIQSSIYDKSMNINVIKNGGATNLDLYNVLSTNNMRIFEPTYDYHPVHKKYVDTALRQASSGLVDLGLIDMDEYDGDYFAFMDTLTETGTYKFIDSYDEFTWYVIVYNLDQNIGQTYFNEEEGYQVKYSRTGYSNGEGGYDWQGWYSGETARNVSYRDNVGYGVYNVQDGLDEAFNTMDYMQENINKLGVKNLGTIAIGDYEDDIFMFIDTLTEEGRYRFVDDDDGFSWYVEVVELGNGKLGQMMCSSETGYADQSIRNGYKNSSGCQWDQWTSYATAYYVQTYSAQKNHTHYYSMSTADSIRTYLDKLTSSILMREYRINSTSDSCLYHAKIDFRGNYRYQEYYSIQDPSKIYRRTGVFSSGKVTWNPWYVFEGTPE